MWCVELVSPHLQYMCSPWSMLAHTCLSMHVRTDAQYSTVRTPSMLIQCVYSLPTDACV